MKEKLYYDFHIHSCLSPCGDDDMTPQNIVGMARLKELDVIAVTDHNTCANCGAVMEAAQGTGLLVLPGMELCTCEEIHVVCLFETLPNAEAFAAYVKAHTPAVANVPEIYGHQYRMDANDTVVEEEPLLLVIASHISVMDIAALMVRFEGVCFPAHVDKSSYSLLSSLGAVPPECGFSTAEISQPAKIDALCAAHPLLSKMRIVTDSDAHYLWDISERYYCLEAERTVSSVLSALGGTHGTAHPKNN